MLLEALVEPISIIAPVYLSKDEGPLFERVTELLNSLNEVSVRSLKISEVEPIGMNFLHDEVITAEKVITSTFQNPNRTRFADQWLKLNRTMYKIHQTPKLFLRRLKNEMVEVKGRLEDARIKLHATEGLYADVYKKAWVQ